VAEDIPVPPPPDFECVCFDPGGAPLDDDPTWDPGAVLEACDCDFGGAEDGGAELDEGPPPGAELEPAGATLPWSGTG
jgi:hypothetical protein